MSFVHGANISFSSKNLAGSGQKSLKITMSFKRDLSLVREDKIAWVVSYYNLNGCFKTFFWRHHCESSFNVKESSREDDSG